jgi:hypothetical protein
MKTFTALISFHGEHRRIVDYLDGLSPPLRYGDASALMASILNRAFKGEL